MGLFVMIPFIIDYIEKKNKEISFN
jgi:hypothetical protein